MSGYSENQDKEQKPNDQKPEDKKEESQVDEFGYEKTPAEKPEPKKDEPPKEKPQEEREADPATGYDEEPEKPSDEKPSEDDKKPDDKKVQDEGKQDEFELKDSSGKLLPEEVESLKTFVKTHKLSKEVAEALIELKRKEVENYEIAASKLKEESKKSAEKQRYEWYQELKNDPKLGGENFANTLKQVDKVLDQYLPNVKKKLTETKGMLPPYIMKDLAALSDHLFSGESYVNGDPVVPKKDEDEKKENDPLAFYS